MRHVRRLSWVILVVAVPVWGETLTPVERAIVDMVEEDREWTVDLLARSVDVMSATENHEGVRRLADLYAKELEALGFATGWVDQSEVGRAGHLVAEHPGSRGKRILLIGHLDTVLEGETFRREGGLAFGSGVADMKSGNAIALAAVRALHRAGELEGRQVIVVFTGDEEATGKPYSLSRAALVEAGKRSDVALAFEGSVPGTAVVGRRGFSAWQLEVTGSQGHSSTIFGEDRGSGAIFEAARILSAFYDELRQPNITYNPSVIVGGTDVTFDSGAHSGTARGKTNVVPGKVVVSETSATWTASSSRRRGRGCGPSSRGDCRGPRAPSRSSKGCRPWSPPTGTGRCSGPSTRSRGTWARGPSRPTTRRRGGPATSPSWRKTRTPSTASVGSARTNTRRASSSTSGHFRSSRSARRC